MGVHKLEIELTDEMMETVDRLSIEQQSTPSDVVVETLKDHLPFRKEIPVSTIAERLAALERVREVAESLGLNRSQDDIDRQVRELRADRTYDR